MSKTPREKENKKSHPLNNIIFLIYAEILLWKHQEECKICQDFIKHSHEIMHITTKVLEECF
jgi:hypothetical protein